MLKGNGQKSNKKRKYVYVLIGIVIAVALLAGGYFGYLKYEKYSRIGIRIFKAEVIEADEESEKLLIRGMPYYEDGFSREFEVLDAANIQVLDEDGNSAPCLELKAGEKIEVWYYGRLMVEPEREITVKKILLKEE